MALLSTVAGTLGPQTTVTSGNVDKSVESMRTFRSDENTARAAERVSEQPSHRGGQLCVRRGPSRHGVNFALTELELQLTEFQGV